ncbi:tRNA-dihydrouridine synthase, partial [Salmonella enterica]|uniref:tRNA-dihydrouridine synthase n=1 Tax=Salmonella enterica TaxID=28901 RepID=UPI001D0C74A6
MRVLLAPMEGVLDALVRELLTEVNDYDLCITEFVRVVDQLLPVKVFHRICPTWEPLIPMPVPKIASAISQRPFSLRPIMTMQTAP